MGAWDEAMIVYLIQIIAEFIEQTGRRPTLADVQQRLQHP